jgi:6-pyruvoyltetrahydropterin/6-carboxytetrahydropterin synthase
MFTEEYGIELEKYFKFNSSHFVVYKDWNEPLHGHNYKVSIKLKSKKLNEEFMVFDFDVIKKIATEICNNLKHCLLLPKFNKGLKFEEEDNNLKITCKDGTFFSIDKKSVRIIDTHQISAECLSKYFAEKVLEKLKEIEHFDQLEITKLECRIYEDKGKCGIFTLKKKDK